jgi:hypothetical protein
MYAILYLPEGKIVRPGIPPAYYYNNCELKACLNYLYYGASKGDIFFNSEPLCNTLYKKAPAYLFEVVEVEDD